MVPIPKSPEKLDPYNITFHSDTGFYTFTTEQGLEYVCRFGNVMSMLPPLLGIYDIEVCDFIFYPYDPKPGSRKKQDPRISVTIRELLKKYFFIKAKRIIVYICDDSDRSFGGRFRQKLFRSWCKDMSDFIVHHELEVEIETTAGFQIIYGGILIRKDLPDIDIFQTQLIDNSSGIILEKFGQ